MNKSKKLSDKTIDLLMLVINVIILGFPLIVATLFFRIDFKEYVFNNYIFSSTLNKAALVLIASSLFVLHIQHNLPSKCYGKTKIKSFIRHLFIGISWLTGVILFLADFVLIIVSLLDIKDYDVFNVNFIIITTLTIFIISIIVNFFSIFCIKKYNFNV